MRRQLTRARRYFLAATMVIVIAGLSGSGTTSKKNKGVASHVPPYNAKLVSLQAATAWLNSPAGKAPGLKGKVVLVQFCTYTCINWLRTLPYIRAWAEKYKDKGLVVIGVHSPEFPFEKNIDNIRRAMADRNISFPIAIDNKFQIWNSFSNQYWPELHLFDSRGYVRHHQAGEGGYELCEQKIQQLLAEAGVQNVSAGLSNIKPAGVEIAADWPNLQSGENYLGYERTVNFKSHRSGYDKNRVYATPSYLSLNHWAVSGNWVVQKQSIILDKGNGKIIYRFQARDLHLVMGAAAAGITVPFRILINGKAPGPAHGLDVDEDGYGKVSGQRLYQLVRQPGAISSCLFEIEFFSPGVEAFSFTFG